MASEGELDLEVEFPKFFADVLDKTEIIFENFDSEVACEQAPSEGRKKFGERKRDSVCEASGSRSVNPRAKRVGRGGACRHCF